MWQRGLAVQLEAAVDVLLVQMAAEAQQEQTVTATNASGPESDGGAAIGNEGGQQQAALAAASSSQPSSSFSLSLQSQLQPQGEVARTTAQTAQMTAAETSGLSQQKTPVLSQQQILCVSETWPGPDTSKSPYLDNRKVTFQTDGTPNPESRCGSNGHGPVASC